MNMLKKYHVKFTEKSQETTKMKSKIIIYLIFQNLNQRLKQKYFLKSL